MRTHVMRETDAGTGFVSLSMTPSVMMGIRAKEAYVTVENVWRRCPVPTPLNVLRVECAEMTVGARRLALMIRNVLKASRVVLKAYALKM